VRLDLTVGDPAGIGPEIVLKALSSGEAPRGEWVVYGPVAPLKERACLLGLRTPADLGVEVADTGGGPVALGGVSAEGGRAAASAVLGAARDALAGRVAAVVTAPLHKESLRAAGYPWPGHTEMLAEAAGVSDVAMMFVGGGLRVALLTIHRPAPLGAGRHHGGRDRARGTPRAPGAASLRGGEAPDRRL
jgi:4-hydroxy-L-threonine phosphate dehydrogenase PdxA